MYNSSIFSFSSSSSSWFASDSRERSISSRAVIYSDLSILCFNLSFGISVEHSFSILFFSSFTFSYSFKCLISEGEYWFSRFLSSLIRKAVLEKVIKEYLGI